MSYSLFQSNYYQQVFAKNQLSDFDTLWASDIDWLEAPNEERGGWSGVGALSLAMAEGVPLQVFVKKQQNHGRLSLRHPIAGEPTFRREFERLKYLQAQGFAAPKVVFYAEKVVKGKQRAILVTEALTGYTPLDEVTQQLFQQPNHASQRILLHTLAASLRQFHALGLTHRALYPKHIFLKNTSDLTEIALIDLEKARFSPFFWYRAYLDLAALNRHAEYWRGSQRMYFFLQYCQLKRLNFISKWFCNLIIKRAKRE